MTIYQIGSLVLQFANFLLVLVVYLRNGVSPAQRIGAVSKKIPIVNENNANDANDASESEDANENDESNENEEENDNDYYEDNEDYECDNDYYEDDEDDENDDVYYEYSECDEDCYCQEHYGYRCYVFCGEDVAS